jgi:hypothetical protein
MGTCIELIVGILQSLAMGAFLAAWFLLLAVIVEGPQSFCNEDRTGTPRGETRHSIFFRVMMISAGVMTLIMIVDSIRNICA